MNKKLTKEQIERFSTILFLKLNKDDIIKLWNKYAAENDENNVIFRNNEEFINSLSSPYEALKKTLKSHYSIDDDYCWFSKKGKLESNHWLGEMPININTLAEWTLNGNKELLLSYGLSENDLNLILN